MAVTVIFFIPLLNEFGHSKLFELHLIFHYGTTMAVKTEQLASVTLVRLGFVSIEISKQSDDLSIIRMMVITKNSQDYMLVL